KRTGTIMTCGSFAFTTNQSTTARKTAVPFSSKCCVNAAITRRCSESATRRGFASVIRDRSAVGGFARRARGGGLDAEQLRDQGAIALRAPIVRADPLAANRPLAADHERLGISGRLVRLFDAVRRIVEYLERHAKVLRERSDRILAHVVVDAHR